MNLDIMDIKFTKMHGCGNDFVVIDATKESIDLTTAQIQELADRKQGIGCDQILLLSKATSQDADFDYVIYNNDGSRVGQCGNGARCVAKYAYDHQLIASDNIRLQAQERILQAKILNNGQVQVDMGCPIFDHAQIPCSFDAAEIVQSLSGAHGETFKGCVLSMGNPHLVLLVNDIHTIDVVSHGRFFNQHKSFPEGVNVGFMCVLSPTELVLRVYERGAGETLACGSGACAGVVAGHVLGLLEETVSVKLQGGSLSIEQQNFDQSVLMTGPAVSVFEGIYKI